MSPWLQVAALWLTDRMFALLPRPMPSTAALQSCRLISHRGEHDNRGPVKENTLAAFRRACDAGVWGLETDIRWSRDLVPLVVADDWVERLHGKWFRLPEGSFDAINYGAMALFKTLIFVFNLVPYLVLRLFF